MNDLTAAELLDPSSTVAGASTEAEIRYPAFPPETPVTAPSLEGTLLSAGAYDAVLAYLGVLTSQRSRRVMRSTLLQIARRLGFDAVETAPWHLLNRSVVMRLVAELTAEVLPNTKTPRYAPASINRCLSAIKGVAKEARYLGLMSAEDYQGIRDVKGVRGSRLPRGRALEQTEARQILDACETGPEARRRSARDKAMFALLFGAGVRRSELVALNMETLNFREQRFSVVGKGNKERHIDMTPRAWKLLQEWLSERGREPGPVFVRIRKGDQITPDRLTDQAVYYLTTQLKLKAGLDHVSPHDMRRSFITWMLDDGEDISLVADMVGHSDLRTTKRYDMRSSKRRQQRLREKDF